MQLTIKRRGRVVKRLSVRSGRFIAHVNLPKGAYRITAITPTRSDFLSASATRSTHIR